ncbi:MAG: 1-acyl-sn-glycerol-3-phosphate acyltransferase, partial [Paraglaciecola psychrophila]
MTVRRLTQTIFRTAPLNAIIGALSRLIMKAVGWKIGGQRPTLKKYVLLAAPHTSNWDFILIVMVAFRLQLDVHWMGKKSLFFFPFARIMLWLGGIPIDRTQTNDVVTQVVEQFQSNDELIVLIPPEGTRSKVSRWKTGFYHIAMNAQVPLVLGFVDAGTKTIGFGPGFIPTGNIEQDFL